MDKQVVVDVPRESLRLSLMAKKLIGLYGQWIDEGRPVRDERRKDAADKL